MMSTTAVDPAEGTATASANSRSTSARSVASPDQAIAADLVGDLLGQVLSMSTQSTRAPAWTSACAVCRPIPLPAPTTTTPLPSRRSRPRKSGTGESSVRVMRTPSPSELPSGSVGSQFGDDLLAEHLDRAHDVLVVQVAQLHVADELVDAEVGVVLHLADAGLDVADDDHVGGVERLDRHLTLDHRLEQRERLVLLLRREVRQLPVERELREVACTTRRPSPRPAVSTGCSLVADVHEGVRRDLVGGDVGERRRDSRPPRGTPATCAAIVSSGCMIENDSSPRPFLPATSAEPLDVAAIQHGGCGSCHGLGVTIRLREA